jgi:hypothetical protein
MTKVEAVKALLKANGGKATWAEIYAKITKYYPAAKASSFWQEGIRGIVYREMRYKRSFKFAGKGVVALR